MRSILFYSILCIALGSQNIYGQCEFITPPAVKKINYASREITFSNVTMNGKETTYLAVQKGATVKIKTNVASKKIGNYCPDCIVQIYWGIRGHTSVCAKSFHGYQFSKKNSILNFKAPMKDGIYYITMGSTLDYSCKNNKYRPNCPQEFAFAVLKVGNPDPEKKITLTEVKKGTNAFLKTTLVKSGCFGDLDKTEWFFDDKKLAYDDQKEIPLNKPGTYRVLWSNCLGSVSKSFNHALSDKKATVKLEIKPTAINNTKLEIKPTVTKNPKLEIKPSIPENPKLAIKPTTPGNVKLEIKPNTPEDIETLIKNNDKFVLEHLIFDLSKSVIRPEAKMDLNKLAQIMKDKPSMRILLEGHTDNRGGAKQNQILSEKRVKATKKYLISQGVKGSKIETKGWGDKKPLIITDDVEKGKINRRVEISILSR